MLGWIRRMTPRQLMFGWLGYWTVLGAAALWHPLSVAWRLTVWILRSWKRNCPVAQPNREVKG